MTPLLLPRSRFRYRPASHSMVVPEREVRRNSWLMRCCSTALFTGTEATGRRSALSSGP
ncbi:hypothetical protein D9M70_603270 [compost metagenome]